MNYDNFKQRTPDEDELEQYCSFCGNPTNETYCSKDCKKADLND